MIPDYAFSIGWAVALLAVGIWGARENRRWVVNVAAVFGGIHFYTQWFSILGANALSVLGGGALILLIAMALYRYNKAAVALRWQCFALIPCGRGWIARSNRRREPVRARSAFGTVIGLTRLAHD